jgi:hypothetical protein
MTREDEFKKLKELIKKHYRDAQCGIYNTRNIVRDKMTTLFNGKFFTLDICYFWMYFEVFGTNDEEWQEIEELYSLL